MIAGKFIKKLSIEGNEIILRYPKKDDTEMLLKWINSLIKEKVYLGIQKKMTFKKETEWIDKTLDSISKKKMISVIAECEGKIIGMSDVIKKTFECKNHIGGLGIALAKEARGTGLAKIIANYIIKEAKRILKVKIVELTVMKPNKRAYKFYKKMGFEEVGTIRKGIIHYGRYLDEIIMVKYV